MDWFHSLMKGSGKVRAEDGNEMFDGTWEEADKLHGGLTSALRQLMDFAMNRGNDGEGVRTVGSRVIFKLLGVVVDVKDADGELQEEGRNCGDYEIEVRRVR